MKYGPWELYSVTMVSYSLDGSTGRGLEVPQRLAFPTIKPAPMTLTRDGVTYLSVLGAEVPMVDGSTARVMMDLVSVAYAAGRVAGDVERLVAKENA